MEQVAGEMKLESSAGGIDESLDNNQPKIRNIVCEFIREYKNKPPEESDIQWLNRQFAKYPNLWISEADRQKDAEIIVYNIEGFEKNKAELNAHFAAGKSCESYLIPRIETAATAHGVVSVGNYATRIDDTLGQANRDMLDRVYCHNPDGSIDMSRINQNPQLNGNLAETHHANTFNIDAAAKESSLKAKALESNGKNSVDLQIYDKDGNVVRRYQSKYGKDAEKTAGYFEDGDYRGQRKLVPDGQAEEIPGSTDHIESDGVRSESISKEDAQKMQDAAQKEGKIPEYEWSDVNKVAIAKAIGKKAAIAGVLAVGFQGARILGRRFYNYFAGKENQSAEDDLKEFVSSSIQSAGGAGIAVATTGGITVAIKNGWFGKVLQGTPAGVIANAVCIAIENVKILYKLGSGQISGKEAIDQVGNATLSLVGGIAGGTYGATWGGAIGMALGPVGAVVGSVAGGIVGSIAGGTVGSAIHAGAKQVISAVREIVSTAWSGVKSFTRALNPLNW